MKSLRTAMAFAITVGTFYALCTVAWVVAPGLFLQFMNDLFHGMDFAPLVREAGFDFSGFAEALLLLSAWAFLAGTFFNWLSSRLIRG